MATTSALAAELTPFQPPLGPQPANPNLYRSEPVTLQMKEKVWSLSGDDFHVTTVDGAEVCRCKGKAISARGKKKFTDPQENEIFTISNNYLSLSKSFHGVSPNGYDFEVKGHFKLMGSKSSITFKNASDGRELELELKGDWIDRSASIKYQDRSVAHIARSFLNAREMVGDKQTYFVTVAPNVDLSLIAAICVCLDERENES